MSQRIDLTKGFIELDQEDRLLPYLERLSALRSYLPALSTEFGRFEDLLPEEIGMLFAQLGEWSSALEAIAMKYLMSVRVAGESGFLTVDRAWSGLPVWQEMVTLAQDQEAAADRLATMRSQAEIKSSMLRTMLRDQISPSAQQYAMTQRIFREMISEQKIMLPRSRLSLDRIMPRSDGRSSYLISWTIIDVQTNQPLIYLLRMEDSNGQTLGHDDHRLTKLRSLVFGQSHADAGILDMAISIDNAVDSFHPKSLRRIALGPLLSPDLTISESPMQVLLNTFFPGSGKEWALGVDTEVVQSLRSYRSGGFFASAEREQFEPAPRKRSGWLMSQGAYNAVCETPGAKWQGVRKYVAGTRGRLIAHG